jgi:hydrogenase maturation protease
MFTFTGDLVRTVVVGIGNDFRGDDGAGIIAARLLRKSSLNGSEVVEMNGELTGLLEKLDGCDTLIVIDAIQSQSPPGTIHRFDASQIPLPDNRNRRSTHGISLGSVIELARVQKTLPRRVLVFGIEGASFEHGARLTPSVETSVRDLVEELTQNSRSSEL